MNNLNYTFFEEYKHLDKLCGDMYGEQYGISHYINDMKSNSGNGCRHISNWNDDLKKLIRIRHVRNYLAHTEGAFSEAVCTQNDIEWSRDFYKRVLECTDPLAMLNQYNKAMNQMKEKQRLFYGTEAYLLPQNKRCKEEKQISAGKKRENIFVWIVLMFVITGAVLLILSGIAVTFG